MKIIINLPQEPPFLAINVQRSSIPIERWKRSTKLSSWQVWDFVSRQKNHLRPHSSCDRWPSDLPCLCVFYLWKTTVDVFVTPWALSYPIWNSFLLFMTPNSSARHRMFRISEALSCLLSHTNAVQRWQRTGRWENINCPKQVRIEFLTRTSDFSACRSSRIPFSVRGGAKKFGCVESSCMASFVCQLTLGTISRNEVQQERTLLAVIIISIADRYEKISRDSVSPEFPCLQSL